MPHSKTYKMAAMTSSKQHFKNLKKVSSQIFDKIMWSKFHKNWPNRFQIKSCDRKIHTYTHTDRRTDRARSGIKYSIISGLNILTRRTSPVCASVCVCVHMNIFHSFRSILMKMHSNDFNKILRWHFFSFFQIFVWWRHNGHFICFQMQHSHGRNF